MTRPPRLPGRPIRLAASGVALVLLAACTTAADASTDADPTGPSSGGSTAATVTSATPTAEIDGDDDVATDDTATVAGSLGAVGTLASDEPHEISLVVDDGDFASMVDTYASTGEKEWLEATVTIDGATYEQVGVRLKGNSSLRGVSAEADPETLPWLIRLDELVDGQDHDGLTELVVRSNTSATSLNEAVALELLDLAGLASQDAIAAAFSVNGSDAVLRLVVEHPDDVWMAEELDADGALYKAESTGDYSYRGDDPDSYDEVFDQEAGDDNADLGPLIAFLDFVNNSDDAAFTAELDEWLDIDAFATYLAMQELIDNFDDIDGPGNNSYLFYDPDAATFTVVAWDHNLAFGTTPGGAGGGLGPPGAAQAGAGADLGAPGALGELGAAEGARPPVDGPEERRGPGIDGGAIGPRERSNVLVERFLADDEWQALSAQRLEQLRTSLYDSGTAAEVLAEWRAVVTATGLVDEATVDSEADQIAARFA